MNMMVSQNTRMARNGHCIVLPDCSISNQCSCSISVLICSARDCSQRWASSFGASARSTSCIASLWGPETFRVRAAKTPTCTFGWTGRVGDRIRTDLCLEFSDTREQAVEEDWLKQWATRKFRRAARLPELDG